MIGLLPPGFCIFSFCTFLHYAQLLPPDFYTSYNNMIQSCVSKFSSLIPSPFSRFVLFSRQNGTRHIITALMSRSQAFAKETTSSYQDEKTSILSNNCGKILCQKTPTQDCIRRTQYIPIQGSVRPFSHHKTIPTGNIKKYISILGD